MKIRSPNKLHVHAFSVLHAFSVNYCVVFLVFMCLFFTTPIAEVCVHSRAIMSPFWPVLFRKRKPTNFKISSS